MVRMLYLVFIRLAGWMALLARSSAAKDAELPLRLYQRRLTFVRAVELNVAHGLPLTMAERKLAATRIVASQSDLSDRAIARSRGLSGKTIAGIRRSAADNPHTNTRRGRDGRVYPKLKKDPSLRFSDGGREFLLLLQLQYTALGKWPQLAEKLPGHCTDLVMQFARRCAEEWDAPAGALRKRSTS